MALSLNRIPVSAPAGPARAGHSFRFGFKSLLVELLSSLALIRQVRRSFRWASPETKPDAANNLSTEALFQFAQNVGL
ncbi:MAG: hypothetical protein QOG67_2403 [Verrucomicrobiota bacterium]